MFPETVVGMITVLAGTTGGIEIAVELLQEFEEYLADVPSSPSCSAKLGRIFSSSQIVSNCPESLINCQ